MGQSVQCFMTSCICLILRCKCKKQSLCLSYITPLFHMGTHIEKYFKISYFHRKISYFIYDWFMLEKDILKCLLNIKNYASQNYIVRHLIFYSNLLYFFICAMLGEGGSPPQKKSSHLLYFNVSRLPDATLNRWQALQN